MRSDESKAPWTAALRGRVILVLLVMVLWRPGWAAEEWSGRRIMEEAAVRHGMAPHVYDERTIILMDHTGNRDVMKARQFLRMEKGGELKYLLVFDNPPEIRGVALLVLGDRLGRVDNRIYLPALGKMLTSGGGDHRGVRVLSTDFTIGDLSPDVPSRYRYTRIADTKLGPVACFVVEASPRTRDIEQVSGYSLRRLFVQKENVFVVRIDYYDRRGRFIKSESRHELKRVNDRMWCADMVLMQNFKERHKTLIKINRRIFSRDYVPNDMFSTDWLLNHGHVTGRRAGAIRTGGDSAGERP